jgi:hypothetical protein
MLSWGWGLAIALPRESISGSICCWFTWNGLRCLLLLLLLLLLSSPR